MALLNLNTGSSPARFTYLLKVVQTAPAYLGGDEPVLSGFLRDKRAEPIEAVHPTVVNLVRLLNHNIKYQLSDAA